MVVGLFLDVVNLMGYGNFCRNAPYHIRNYLCLFTVSPMPAQGVGWIIETTSKLDTLFCPIPDCRKRVGFREERLIRTEREERIFTY